MDDLGIVVRVTAGVDVMTGVATWELTALDPLTGLPASDAHLGLLKPNTNRTQFGSVSYTIKGQAGNRHGNPPRIQRARLLRQPGAHRTAARAEHRGCRRAPHQLPGEQPDQRNVHS